jgi:hypothetical protein
VRNDSPTCGLPSAIAYIIGIYLGCIESFVFKPAFCCKVCEIIGYLGGYKFIAFSSREDVERVIINVRFEVLTVVVMKSFLLGYNGV